MTDKKADNSAVPKRIAEQSTGNKPAVVAKESTFISELTITEVLLQSESIALPLQPSERANPPVAQHDLNLLTAESQPIKQETSETDGNKAPFLGLDDHNLIDAITAQRQDKIQNDSANLVAEEQQENIFAVNPRDFTQTASVEEQLEHRREQLRSNRSRLQAEETDEANGAHFVIFKFNTFEIVIKIENGVATVENMTPAAAKILLGGRGIDTLIGDTGNDTLTGGYGADTINGGAGDDIIYADGQAFNNLTVANMSLWLDAGDISGDGTNYGENVNVTTWVDKSGQGNNATGGIAPSYTMSGAGGRGSVHFERSDTEYLDLPTGMIPTGNSNYSMIAVVDFNTVGANQILFFFGNQSNDQSIFTRAHSDLAYNTGWWGNNLSTSANAVGGTGVSNIVGSLYDGTGRTSYVDGGLVAGKDSATNKNTGSTFAYLGAEPNGGPTANHLDGEISEFLFFNEALTTSERQTIDEYLSYKYGAVLTGESFGADTLSGGDGADTFIWSNASHSGTGVGNRDIITDFSISDGDKIDLSTLSNDLQFNGADGLLGGGIKSIAYSIDVGNNRTVLQIDLGGSGTADMEIELTGQITLTPSEFILSSNVTEGTAGADVLAGTVHNDIIDGKAGNDTITGGRGGDVLTGGDGNDTITGGYGGDVINGGAGNDVIYADGQSFANNTFGNMSLWLDGSDINGNGTAFTNNANVTTWTDKSGNGHNATGGDAPSYTINGAGGRGAVFFDLANTEYLQLSTSMIPTGNTSYSFFFVFDANNSGAHQQLFYMGTNSSNQAIFGRIRNDLSFETGWYSNTLGSGGPVVDGGGTTNVISSFYDGTGRTHYIDNINIGSDSATAKNTGSSVGFLGAEHASGQHFSGEISEVIFYNAALSASEQAIVDEYLAYKYQVALGSVGFGRDILTGGAGNDTFTWTNASHSGVGSGNRDIIKDFRRGDSSSDAFSAAEEDKIDITGLNLNYLNSDAFTGSANELRWTVSGSNTLIEIDFNGDSTKDMEIELTGVTRLQSDYFIGLNNATTVNLTTGTDTLTPAGNGYNTFRIESGELAVGTDTLTGGTGHDTITVLDGQTIDLTGVSQIISIERIDLGVGAHNNQVNLSLTDLLAMTDASDTLTIDGDANDTLQMSTPGDWAVQNGGVPVTIAGTGYYHFYNAANTATLYFDADMSHNLTV